MKKPKRTPAKDYPKMIVPASDLQRLTEGIDANVKRMLQEDAVVGRWVRLSFPDKFEEFLQRARKESKFRQIMKKEGKW